jgi:LL-diaminopimelate aminotransferase
MTFQKALRLQKLPPYVFAAVNEKKRKLMAEGKDLIDLGMGDCDLPTPDPIITALSEAARVPKNHRYSSYVGLDEFRKTAAQWLDRRFSVAVDWKTEVMNVIGSKEGLAHFTQCFVNPGDYTLSPDPGYPVYGNATVLSGGTPLFYPLLWENDFRPMWSGISENVWKSTKIVFINYPHNPTSATASLDTYAELVDRARHYNFIICSDGPYCEQGYDALPPCLLQVPRAKEVGIEFFSFSKTYNMTGWRIGFAAGNAELISALHQIKSTLDTGIFMPIQYAAIAALKGSDRELIEPSKEVYGYRRKIMVEGLKRLGYEVFDGRATFYLWIKCPQGQSSTETAAHLMDKGVVVTPGVGFGACGEGYFRISLTVSEERLEEALRRMGS